MGTNLLVAAERIELAGLLARAENVVRLNWGLNFACSAEIRDRRWFLAANGVGPKLAAKAVEEILRRERIETVVSAGTCGALEPELQRGDIFVAAEVCTPETGFTCVARVPRTARPFRKGTLISVDRVVQSEKEKRRLAEQGAGAVDMEAAAVGALAMETRLQFYCIKVVLDRAGEEFQLDFNSVRKPDGGFSRLRIVRAALAHPAVLAPELIRIQRACRIASRSLGEFIAECIF